MKPLISCAESTDLDRSTQERAKLPPGILMEDASVRLWDALKPLADSLGAGREGRLTALCGSGSNAGDTLALLRHAHFAGYRNLAVILGKAPPGELAQTQLAGLAGLGVPQFSWETEAETCRELLSQSRLLVDGIAGTGLQGPLREPLVSLVLAARDCGIPIAAIDFPSGLADDHDPARLFLPARWSLALEPRKAVLYFPSVRTECGEIIGVGGVFPFDAAGKGHLELLETEDLRVLVPPIAPSAYKGSRGKVAVFAGSLGATGAASLSSQACLAAGAGLVALYVSTEILPILSAKLDAVMVKPEPDEPGSIDPSRWDSLLLGPGWGRTDRNRLSLAKLLSLGLPSVLDADAISLFAELVSKGFRSASPLILTPHPGELARLGVEDIHQALANPPRVLPALAARFGATIVFKTHCTWVAAPDGSLSVWDGSEAALGTAGSGDVLAGLTAGLLATASVQARTGLAPDRIYDVARAGVIVHGLAGRNGRRRRGWFQASALIEEAALLLANGSPSLGGAEPRGALP